MKLLIGLSVFVFILSACAPLGIPTPEPGQIPGTYEYQDFAYDIVWSQDDSMIALTTNIGLYVYDARTHKELFKFDQNGSTVVFGEKYLAFVNWEGLFVYELNGFQLLFHEEPADGRMFNNLAISPDDKSLAASEQDRMRVWSLPDGKTTSTIYNENQVFVSDMVFKNNTRIVITDTYYGNVQEWNVSSQKLIRTFDFSRPVIYLQASSNGKLVLVDYGLTGFELWNIETGKIQHAYGDIVSASGWQRLSGNNQYVVVWGYAFDGKTSGMSVWDLNTHVHVQEFTTPFVNGDGWRCGALNSDGSILAASNNEGYIYFYNAANGEKTGEIFLPYKYIVEKG
jgi:WD40 repeat protein